MERGVLNSQSVKLSSKLGGQDSQGFELAAHSHTPFLKDGHSSSLASLPHDTQTVSPLWGFGGHTTAELGGGGRGTAVDCG